MVLCNATLHATYFFEIQLHVLIIIVVQKSETDNFMKLLFKDNEMPF